MTTAPPGVRSLFQAAMLIFIITIVIGILNGIDVWDVPRNTLLTHVHAGTLGWITLAVFAGAIWMFGSADDRSTGRLATFSIVALSLYILAFWSVDLTTDSIQRPIGGTLAFVAMAWMFVWVIRQKRGEKWNVAELGMGLALGFLVLGAVLGVLLGLQLAEIEIVAPENADQLYESHPGAMIAGFVVLAALALIEWLMPGRKVPSMSESKSGVVQMLLLFTAGLLFVVGSLFAVDPLLQVAGVLQLLTAFVLIGRFRRQLVSGWAGSAVDRYVRMAVVGMVIVVILVVYLISQISTGAEFEDVLPVALAFDHLNFIMVVTNLVFAMLTILTRVTDMANRLIFWSVNVGVLGFAAGLMAENQELKRIFTPLLGIGLLYAIWTFLTAPKIKVMEPESV